MVAAIGSTAGSTALPRSAVAVAPTAGLEAQIARYQKQLSDCVNCSSAKTLQGKQTIQEISNKINVAKARIEEINVTKSVTQPVSVDKKADTAAPKDAAVSGIDALTVNVGTLQSNSLKLTSDTVGSQINTLA